MMPGRRALWFAFALLVAWVARRVNEPSLFPIEQVEMRDAPSSRPLSPGHSNLGDQRRSSCAYCHPAPGGEGARPRWALSGWRSEAAPSAVPSSAICLSCHDGAMARAGGTTLDDSHGNHPIGIDYEVVRAYKPGRYNDLSSRPDVRLENGKIGCASCHVLHRGPTPGERTAVNESACEACHNL